MFPAKSDPEDKRGPPLYPNPDKPELKIEKCKLESFLKHKLF